MPHPNAYRARVAEFPGRLFDRIDDPEQLAVLHGVCSAAAEVFVELGSGSGSHLIAQSLKHPHAALFGFELRFKRAVRTLEKADTAEAKNLHVIRAHTQLFPKLFSSNSLSGVWVNFPDPWDKRKKNRMLNQSVLADIYSRLKAGGFLSFKTDHLEFFESVLGQMTNDGVFQIERVIYDIHRSEECPPENVVTEFESLFRSKALPVYHLLGRKNEPSVV